MVALETQDADRPGSYRVVVLDDRRLIREGLAEMLSTCADLEVVATCDELPGDANAAVVVLGRTRAVLPTTVRTVVLDGVADPAALIAAVRAASAGSVAGISQVSSSLTQRERAVLRAVSAGDSAVEIGATLQISPRTVERHKQNARAKLGGPNQAVTIARALERGLLEEPT
jgi:DNA-binding NarL/FixJ family response regulator